VDGQTVNKIWVGPQGTIVGGEKPAGIWVSAGSYEDGLMPKALEAVRAIRLVWAEAIDEAVQSAVRQGWSSVNANAVMIGGHMLVVGHGVYIDELESYLWRHCKPGIIEFSVTEYGHDE
jgi:hypothetical protein